MKGNHQYEVVLGVRNTLVRRQLLVQRDCQKFGIAFGLVFDNANRSRKWTWKQFKRAAAAKSRSIGVSAKEINLQDGLTQDDIKRYITNALKHSGHRTFANWPDDIRNDVADQLIKRANGMYVHNPQGACSDDN